MAKTPGDRILLQKDAKLLNPTPNRRWYRRGYTMQHGPDLIMCNLDWTKLRAVGYEITCQTSNAALKDMKVARDS